MRHRVEKRWPGASRAWWLGLIILGSNAAEPVSAELVPTSPEGKLLDLGIVLTEPSPPMANYVRSVRAGNLVFLSGHGPRKEDGSYVEGRVGRDLTLEEGYDAARRTAVSLLSSLKAEIGDLSRVKRIVRVFGLVNAEPDFTQHPAVINGCSDLLVELFGERGRHARAAVGAASLPLGTAVEIEMIVEIEEEGDHE